MHSCKISEVDVTGTGMSAERFEMGDGITVTGQAHHSSTHQESQESPIIKDQSCKRSLECFL